MLKIGVLGAGHLGKIHIKCIQQIPAYNLVGFFDLDKNNASKVESEFGIKSYNSIEELIDEVDVVDIVTPTLSHFECAELAIRKSKHIFIEKPVTSTLEEAKTLMNLAHEASVKVQVGHVERFNPAFIAAKPYCNHPMFIETHRLAQFNPRGTDVSVVLDLMIHDIDIVLSLVQSSVKTISASGVAVISDTPDIANARIEFTNGCVANLTASRMSMKNMRKTRLFQKDTYIAIDFLEKQSEIIRLNNVEGDLDPLAITIDPGNGKPIKQLYFDKPETKETNAILEELKSLANSIQNDERTKVTIDDGYNALNVAYQILEKLRAAPTLISN